MQIEMPLSEPWADDSRIILSAEAAAALADGTLALTITKHGNKPRIRNFRAEIGALSGHIRIALGNDDARVTIGRATGTYDLKLWRASVVRIGDATTCRSARLTCDNSVIQIGRDCMISGDIVMQSSDQHAIVDLATKRIINGGRKSITVGDHVWLARRVTLLHGTDIGNGSYVGFGSLVRGRHEAHCMIAGVPATTHRRGVTWSRHPHHLDAYAQGAVDQDQPMPDGPRVDML